MLGFEVVQRFREVATIGSYLTDQVHVICVLLLFV
jgi:hypothetical protein